MKLIKYTLVVLIFTSQCSLMLAQKEFNNLDSAFLNNLKQRIIFGVDRKGEMVKQIEHLYNSPDLKKYDYVAGAGTEAKITGKAINRKNKKVRQIECTPLHPENSLLIRAWIPDSLKDAFTVFDILKELNKNRMNSEITCAFSFSDSGFQGNTNKFNLTFENNSNEPKTIYLQSLHLRDKNSATPIILQFPTPVDLFQQPVEIEPHKLKSVHIDLSETISSIKYIGQFYLYITYIIRNEGMYDTMISDFVEIDTSHF